MMNLVKNVIESVADPMTLIYVICHLTIKTAKVIPVYKSGEKHLCTNYRPSSLLQFFLNIEKLYFST